jgi:hypothetical protein
MCELLVIHEYLKYTHTSSTAPTYTASFYTATLVHLVEVDKVDSPFPNALIAAV